jgi:hypothetical protein
MVVRLIRMTAIAAVLAFLFRISHGIGAVRGHETSPGMSGALAVVALLFLVRALVTEMTPVAAGDLRKDLLWGVAGGCVVTILLRW